MDHRRNVRATTDHGPMFDRRNHELQAARYEKRTATMEERRRLQADLAPEYNDGVYRYTDLPCTIRRPQADDNSMLCETFSSAPLPPPQPQAIAPARSEAPMFVLLADTDERHSSIYNSDPAEQDRALLQMCMANSFDSTPNLVENPQFVQVVMRNVSRGFEVGMERAEVVRRLAMSLLVMNTMTSFVRDRVDGGMNLTQAMTDIMYSFASATMSADYSKLTTDTHIVAMLLQVHMAAISLVQYTCRCNLSHSSQYAITDFQLLKLMTDNMFALCSTSVNCADNDELMSECHNMQLRVLKTVRTFTEMNGDAVCAMARCSAVRTLIESHDYFSSSGLEVLTHIVHNVVLGLQINTCHNVGDPTVARTLSEYDSAVLRLFAKVVMTAPEDDINALFNTLSMFVDNDMPTMTNFAVETAVNTIKTRPCLMWSSALSILNMCFVKKLFCLDHLILHHGVPAICCKALESWAHIDSDIQHGILTVCDKIARRSAATVSNLCASGIVEVLSQLFCSDLVPLDFKARAMHLTALLSIGDIDCVWKIVASPMFKTSTRDSPYSIRLTHMIMILNVAIQLPMATVSSIITDDTLQSLAEFMKGPTPPQQVTVLALRVIERLLCEDNGTWYGRIDAIFADIIHRLALSNDPVGPKTTLRTGPSVSELAGHIVDQFFNE